MDTKTINDLTFWFAITGWIINIVMGLGQICYIMNIQILWPIFIIAVFSRGLAICIYIANILGMLVLLIYINRIKNEKYFIRNLVLVSSALIVYPLLSIHFDL